MPRYVPRSEWAARPPRREAPWFPDSAYVGMEAHHTVTSSRVSAAQTARNVQNMHMDTNGWLDIFYAFLIHPDGTVVEGRGWNRTQGPDVQVRGLDGRTYHFLPVVFIGDYRTDHLTPEAVASWHWLRSILLARNPGATQVRYHGQRAATACPGPHIIGRMADLQGQMAFPIPFPSEDEDMTPEQDQKLTAIFNAMFGGDHGGPMATRIQEIHEGVRAVKVDGPVAAVLTDHDRASLASAISAAVAAAIPPATVSGNITMVIPPAEREAIAKRTAEAVVAAMPKAVSLTGGFA